MYRTAQNWEVYLGGQIKTLRLRMNMSQEELAKRADVGTVTVSRLEGGKGSSLNSFIKVLAVLRQEAWLESLAPEASISPIQLHTLGKERQRARAKAPRQQFADKNRQPAESSKDKHSDQAAKGGSHDL